jgi:hypothetical protein
MVSSLVVPISRREGAHVLQLEHLPPYSKCAQRIASNESYQ